MSASVFTVTQRRSTLAKPGRLLSRRAAMLVLMWIAIAGLASTWWLSGAPGEIRLTDGGLRVAASFLSRALSPALTYESEVPAETPPLVLKALSAAAETVRFAAAAMSLALVGGLLLGFLSSSAWWFGDPVRARSMPARLVRAVGPLIYGMSRILIAVMRSIHELFWAVLLLAAFGVTPLAAVLAIAIPYSGILAKVFSELVDEAPRESAIALRESGASPLQMFLFGLVPRALPDMAAYAFYRFECALRSSAILGFFGFRTLGYYIAASFENLLYGEVWTYLYVLCGLIVLMDWWSGALRRRYLA
jgi:phosphonate transport system permease protein